MFSCPECGSTDLRLDVWVGMTVVLLQNGEIRFDRDLKSGVVEWGDYAHCQNSECLYTSAVEEFKQKAN